MAKIAHILAIIGNALILKYKKQIACVFIAVGLLVNFYVYINGKINIPKGPNVLLIIIDTLRADHLSCYQYDKGGSHNIDSLASHSTLFKNAISMAPWTTPSINSIFTSQYPAVLGIKDLPIKFNNKFLTLAEVFKEHNYKTKGIISHIYLSAALGFNQGFDSYDEGSAKGHGSISSPSVTEKALSFLRKNKNNKFLLFLHYFDPHYDYILHEKFNYFPEYDGSIYSGQSIHELRKIALSLSGKDIKYIKALYDSKSPQIL